MSSIAEQFLARFPAANVKAAYLANAKQLDEMARKAAATGKKVNGYTYERLVQLAEQQRANAAKY